MEMGDNKVCRMWREYFEDLYNMDTQKQVSVHMCGFNVVQRSISFGEELIGSNEGELRV